MSTAVQPSQRTCVKPPCRLLGPSPLCIFLLYSALWTFTGSHPWTLNSFSLTGQDLGILLGPCFHKQTKNKENKNKECYEVHLVFPFSRLRTQCCLFSNDWKQHTFCWIFLLFGWEAMLVSVTVKTEILYALSQVYLLNHENWPYISYKKTLINSKKTK